MTTHLSKELHASPYGECSQSKPKTDLIEWFTNILGILWSRWAARGGADCIPVPCRFEEQPLPQQQQCQEQLLCQQPCADFHDETLKHLFKPFGKIISAKFMRDDEGRIRIRLLQNSAWSSKGYWVSIGTFILFLTYIFYRKTLRIWSPWTGPIYMQNSSIPKNIQLIPSLLIFYQPKVSRNLMKKELSYLSTYKQNCSILK